MKAHAWRARRTGGSDARARVLIVVSILFATEGALYSAVAPLLAHYAHTLHLSRGAAGALVATYSVGLIAGSVLAAALIGRTGRRPTIVLGLAVVSASSIAFGYARSADTLDAFRGVQGIGAGLLWAAGLAWIISSVGPDGRGTLLGKALAAAVFGTIIGPLVGTLAATVSTALVFDCVGLAIAALALLVIRRPEPEHATNEPGTPLRSVIRKPEVLKALWIMVLPAVALSAVNTLVPLRMASLGASDLAVGATYLIGSVLATSVAPVLGRLTDRLGPTAVARTAFIVTTPCLALMIVPRASWGVAVWAVLYLGVAWTACVVPGLTLLSSGTENAGVPTGIGAMVVNLTFAVGEAVGAPAAAKIAQLTSETWTFAMLAGLTLGSVVLVPVVMPRTSESPQPGGGVGAG